MKMNIDTAVIKRNLDLIIAGIIALALVGYGYMQFGATKSLRDESATKLENNTRNYKNVKSTSVPESFGLTNINNISTRLSPDKFKEDYVSTLRTCYIFWIPLSVIQFVFIPTPYHVLYNSGLGFIWNVLLSTLYYSENKLKNRNINSV